MVRDESHTERIPVRSQDPERPENLEPQHEPEPPRAQDPPKESGLSEEDEQLKGELEMLVERLGEPNTALHRPALETLRVQIRTSTSSMTSVPKPLKFLHPHYPQFKELYDQWSAASAAASDRALFAEILSVLAMTYSNTGARETLAYRLRADTMRASTTAEDLSLIHI